MKIMLEHGGIRVTVEMDELDSGAGEVIEMFTRMMVVVGWSAGVIQLADDDGGRYVYVGEDEEVVKRKEV